MEPVVTCVAEAEGGKHMKLPWPIGFGSPLVERCFALCCTCDEKVGKVEVPQVVLFWMKDKTSRNASSYVLSLLYLIVLQICLV